MGKAGSAIRRLRTLCAGVEIEVKNQPPEVFLLADHEDRLEAARLLMEAAVRQQQVGIHFLLFTAESSSSPRLTA